MANDLKILLVDDDVEKRFLLARGLSKVFENATVLECGSGADAIVLLANNDVQAIVTDHSMSPVDGIELIKWVRAHYRPLPILMVTGHPAIEQRALEAGATLVVGSYQFKEVGAILKQLLKKGA